MSRITIRRRVAVVILLDVEENAEECLVEEGMRAHIDDLCDPSYWDDAFFETSNPRCLRVFAAPSIDDGLLTFDEIVETARLATPCG